MRLVPAALLFAASGCAQLFGLDETTGGTTDPSRVSLTIQRVSVGASVQKSPLDLTSEQATFLLDDGTASFARIAAENTAPGVWSAPIEDGTPAVLFTLPDVPKPFPRLWQLPARDRIAGFGAHEHANAQPPLPNSSFTFSATLPSPYVSGESFRIDAIGAWTARGVAPLQAPDMGITTISAMAMPYATFGTLTNYPPVRITSQDVVVVERYLGNQLTGVYQVPPFDQTDGADPITAAIAAVPTNHPLTAAITPAVYTQRYSAVRPAVAGLAQSWSVNAAPGWDVGSNAGPRLNAGAPMAVDTTIDAMFGNPFESLGWRALVQYATSSSRTYMLGAMAPLTLSASMVAVAEPSGMLTFDMPAGLPINIRANQIPLSTDGMMIGLDLTKPVVIDAITDKPNGTVYIVTLYEVAVAADMMAVERTIVVDTVTTGQPQVTLPAELFKVGHSYYVDFRTVQGAFPEAATGDLLTRSYPYSVARADSAVFVVMAP